jgi:uncharacterized lipoprotein YajG
LKVHREAHRVLTPLACKAHHITITPPAALAERGPAPGQLRLSLLAAMCTQQGEVAKITLRKLSELRQLQPIQRLYNLLCHNVTPQALASRYQILNQEA